ncbi:MAG: YcaO-like family protein [Dongiaceae bacterium]
MPHRGRGASGASAGWGLPDGGRKRFWHGTHRLATPAETLAVAGRHAGSVGVTRLANISGLDYLGIPIFAAVRPNGRSLSVAQGKGLDEGAARVSALMEAVEFAHAEEIRAPIIAGSFERLRRRHRVAALDRLPRAAGRRLPAGREIAWIGGTILADSSPVLVPFEMVHLDLTLPRRSDAGYFVQGSNGLASGNHAIEAICAGLCELIERDAFSLWLCRGSVERARRRIDLATVDDADCADLIALLSGREMSVAVWDATTEIGVPTFLCRIRETTRNDRSRLGAFWGSGCHPAPGIALARAITESAQTRLTFVAGARDDLRPVDYREDPARALLDHLQDLWDARQGPRSFSEVPSLATPTLAGDLAVLNARLLRSGFPEVIVVDLTRPELGIPVCRVIVPGLEASHQSSGYVQGARALALRGRR